MHTTCSLSNAVHGNQLEDRAAAAITAQQRTATVPSCAVKVSLIVEDEISWTVTVLGRRKRVNGFQYPIAGVGRQSEDRAVAFATCIRGPIKVPGRVKDDTAF